MTLRIAVTLNNNMVQAGLACLKQCFLLNKKYVLNISLKILSNTGRGRES
jgi:hypothetical protein